MLKKEKARVWVEEFVETFYQKHGCLPKRIDIRLAGKRVDLVISSQTIDDLLKSLVARGYARSKRGNKPSAVVLEQPRRPLPESGENNLNLGWNPHPGVGVVGIRAQDAIPSAEEVWAKAVLEQEKHEKEEHKKQNQRLEFPPQPVCLVCMGDRHIGAAGTDYRALKEDSLLIASTPGMFVIDVGDGIDNFIKQKHADARAGDPLRIDEQWVLLQESLRWIEGRFLVSVAGNHNHWSTKIAGYDIFRNLLPQKVLYDPDEVNVTVKVGNSEWKWKIRHKLRASSIYNPLHGHKQHVRLGMQDADVVLAGHIHRGAVYELFYHQGKEKIAILTGTYKTFDAYVKEEGFLGGGLGTTVAVILHPDGWIQPFSNLKAAAALMETLYFQNRMRKGGLV